MLLEQMLIPLLGDYEGTIYQLVIKCKCFYSYIKVCLKPSVFGGLCNFLVCINTYGNIRSKSPMNYQCRKHQRLG